MTNKLTVIAPDFLGYFSAHFLQHLRAGKSDRAVARPATHDPGKQRALLRQVLAELPSALVCLSLRPPIDIIARLRSCSVPVVLVDECAPGAASIMADNEQGGRLAAEHLLSLGHREIMIITGPAGDMNAVQRLSGFREALRVHGVLPTAHLQALDYSARNGEELFDRVEGTAVFCAAGDDCAVGVMKAARREGVSIPHDLSLVGYDDAPIGQIVMPSLTTIRQPIREMAQAAYRLAALERERTLSDPPALVFPSILVARGSTGTA